MLEKPLCYTTRRVYNGKATQCNENNRCLEHGKEESQVVDGVATLVDGNDPA